MQDLKQPIDEDQLRLVVVEAASIRDSYLGDATAAAGLCKQSGGKKRKSDKEVGNRIKVAPTIQCHIQGISKTFA